MARPHLRIIPVPALIPQTLAAGMLLVFAAISAVTVMAGFFRDNADVAGTEVTQLPEDLVPDVGSSAPDEGFRLPVLRYRHIGQAGPGQPDAVPPEVLDRQLSTLLNSGYTFLTMSDLSDILDGRAVLPLRPVVLTFDGGYRDFHTDAFPLIRKYRIPVTLFPPVNLLGRPGHLSVAEVRGAVAGGLVEIGAAGLNYRPLAGVGLSEVQKEVSGSKNELEKLFRVPVHSFSYPFGALDRAAAGAVAAGGYRTAVTSAPGAAVSPENRFFLYRISPGNRSGEKLQEYLDRCMSGVC